MKKRTVRQRFEAWANKQYRVALPLETFDCKAERYKDEGTDIAEYVYACAYRAGYRAAKKAKP